MSRRPQACRSCRGRTRHDDRRCSKCRNTPRWLFDVLGEPAHQFARSMAEIGRQLAVAMNTDIRLASEQVDLLARRYKLHDPVTQRCRDCGCTDEQACLGLLGEPCSWAAPDLCTACAGVVL